jgi:hypothetical protein
MTELVLVIFLLLLVAAMIGLGLLMGPATHETERQRINRETREAERRITDIGRHAQDMILHEALRRAQIKPRAARTDRPDAGFNADGQFGPWND